MGACAEALEDDCKNYHVWSHRQWAIQRFDLWDEEWVFIDKLLEEDMRNNSAWNQRYFLVSKGGSHKDFTVEERNREINFAIKFINKGPNNVSPWNYIRAFVKGQKFSSFPQVSKLIDDLVPSHSGTCANLLAFIVDSHVDAGTPQRLTAAAEFCLKLATDVDQIRSRYWKQREQALRTAAAAQ
eukprot:JP437218.1.p1 GENE.JP437218.1~~JP437218.1.p1  ORF type:complete len:200 (-),score=30.86 JP437218.1:21-572(-)